MSAGTIGSESFDAPQGGNPFTTYMGTQPGAAVSQQPSAAEFNTGLLPNTQPAPQFGSPEYYAAGGLPGYVPPASGSAFERRPAQPASIQQPAPQTRPPEFAGMPDDIYNGMVAYNANKQQKIDARIAQGMNPFEAALIPEAAVIRPWQQWMMAQPDGSYTLGDGGAAYQNYQSAVFGNQPNIYQPNFNPTVGPPNLVNPMPDTQPIAKIADPVVVPPPPITPPALPSLPSNPFAKKVAPAPRAPTPRAPTPRAPTRRSVQPGLMAKPTTRRR